MPRIYKLSRAGLKLLYKIRHHKGHGIHSPFVFNLITKVIEEKTPYHVYDDIRFVLDSKPYKFHHLKKYNLLSFRLVNYFNSKHVLEIGSGYGVNSLCLTAAASDIVCNSVELSVKKHTYLEDLYASWARNIKLHTDHNLPVLSNKQDCIFIDLNNYNKPPIDFVQYLFNLSHEKTFIMVKGIRTNKRNKALWKNIIHLESRTAVLDLFNIGIVFFDKQLYRWNYQISF